MKESVKIDKRVVERIRKHVKKTGQTISGYIEFTLQYDLTQKESYVTVNEYMEGMTPISKSIKESNKKKK